MFLTMTRQELKAALHFYRYTYTYICKLVAEQTDGQSSVTANADADADCL